MKEKCNMDFVRQKKAKNQNFRKISLDKKNENFSRPFVGTRLGTERGKQFFIFIFKLPHLADFLAKIIRLQISTTMRLLK